MSNLRALGREAEDRAANYLIGLGYTIATRRFTVRGGEVDLIALDGDVVVFVEVKLHRQTDPNSRPEDSVDDTKWERIHFAASAWLKEHGGDPETRFDVVAIDGNEIRHHVGASWL